MQPEQDVSQRKTLHVLTDNGGWYQFMGAETASYNLVDERLEWAREDGVVGIMFVLAHVVGFFWTAKESAE